MRKDEITKKVGDALKKLGVKPTHRSVRPAPSCVEVKVVAGGNCKVLRLRSGISPPELELELQRLGVFVDQNKGTVHLEDALAEKVLV